MDEMNIDIKGGGVTVKKIIGIILQIIIWIIICGIFWR